MSLSGEAEPGPAAPIDNAWKYRRKATAIHSLNCNKLLIPSRPSAFWFPPNLRHAEGPRCWCVLCHLFIHDDRQLTQDISGPNCTPRFGPSVALGAFGIVLPWWQDWICVAAKQLRQLPVSWGNNENENDTHMPQIVLKDLVPSCKDFWWRIASWAFESWNLVWPQMAELVALSILAGYATGNAIAYSSTFKIYVSFLHPGPKSGIPKRMS